MKEISSKYSRNHIAIVLIVLNLIGLFSSRILMSNGMIWFFALALVPSSWLLRLPFMQAEPSTFIQRILAFAKYPPFIAQLGIVAVSLFGCLYTTDLNYANKVVFTYSPFFFMPIAFGAIQPFSKRQYTLLLYLYVLIVFLASSAILGNYFIHYDEMNLALKQGQAITTPYHEHIRFSLMICFSICILIYLRMKSYYLYRPAIEAKLQVILAVTLAIYLHVLSVRSGILSLYLCLFVIAIYLAVHYKKYMIAAAIILFIIAAPILSYQFITSIHNKVNYMLWDIEQLKNNKSKNYSDAERIVSILAGYKVLKANPIMGVGTGDIKIEMNKIYDKDYAWINPLNRKMPHNQFLWTLASNGILGLIALIISISTALFYKANYKNILLICFFIISISSFLYEHTLQTQVGVAYYVICLLIILNYLRGKEDVDENRI